MNRKQSYLLNAGLFFVAGMILFLRPNRDLAMGGISLSLAVATLVLALSDNQTKP